MFKRILRWLNVHDKEIGLFLWSMALLFLVRSAGVILNNYAETAFLKRYGVEFLPIVTMLNAIATVVIMGFIFGLIRRFPGSRLLGWQFMFCGVSIISLRLLIPLGLDLIYPLLFMLKAQYEALLAMLFWNMANDLFNTRQSKRLFPLITAGGVLGQIIASFGTPWMADKLQFDNLLVVYMLITAAGAAVVLAMGRYFPSLIIDTRPSDPGKTRNSMIQEIKDVLPMLKASVLMRLMIVLTLMPNVVIPILNYQFNYAVDTHFASESSMITFFGYFRGSLNMISLFILLFVGKIYGRWGLPVALMFHPMNYIIAFLAFLLRFDVFSAMYARMSTNILRTTINVPANAMMMGLFPESYRAMVRPFLRGTVVRIALFIGSGLILISENLFHPRYLSLVALPFVAAWLSAPFILKRKYAGILIDLVQQNQLDLSSMQTADLEHLLRGRKVHEQLKNAFMTCSADNAFWYANLLKQLKYADLDIHIVRRIAGLNASQQSELLRLLSDNPTREVINLLRQLTEQENVTVLKSVLQAVSRFPANQRIRFDLRPFLDSDIPEVRAYAATGLYDSDPSEYGGLINGWILSDDTGTQLAGIRAAGATKDARFNEVLRNRINLDEEPQILSASMESLHALDMHDLNPVVGPFMDHQDKRVRLAALSSFHVIDKESLNTVIIRLADEDPEIRKAAKDRIVKARYVDGKALIKALNYPNMKMRQCIYSILDELQIKDLDLYRFVRDQLEGAYKYLNESNGIATLPETEARNLLVDHLLQQKTAITKRVLRVLAIQDQSGRLKIIRRGLLAKDRRQRANSQEALDDILDKRLSSLLIPLLEDDDAVNAADMGRRTYGLSDYTAAPKALLTHLLSRHDDWLTVLATLYVLETTAQAHIDLDIVADLKQEHNPYVRRLACRVWSQCKNASSKEDDLMDSVLELPDIILKLKTMEIFEGLSISELAAVASVTEEVSFGSDEIVIKEGDPGDTLYLILEGEVAVIKSEIDGSELLLDHISVGDHFGEMALFEDIPRTASIRTTKPCRMLMLHKEEFNEMVREYPKIALEICKVFSGRIRKLHRRISSK